MRKGILFVALLLLTWSFGQQVTFAQATASATLEGTVTDKTQAVIKSATVTITNKATGVTRTTSTNDIGVYRFELLSVASMKSRSARAGLLAR